MCVHACVGEWSFFAVVVSGYRRVPRRILHPKHDMTMEWKECYHKCTCSSAAKYRRAYGTSNAKSCTVSNWSDAEPTDLGTDFGSICVTVAAAMSSWSLSLAAMMAFPLFSGIFRGSVANRLMIFGTNTHLRPQYKMCDIRLSFSHHYHHSITYLLTRIIFTFHKWCSHIDKPKWFESIKPPASGIICSMPPKKVTDLNV